MSPNETVTVAFTDIVGSTELASRIGHDAYEAMRREHFELLRRTLAEHGGREVKNTGDGLMLAFASAADAVSCAIAMQQRVERTARREGSAGLAIRVGISSGDATHEADDLYGPPVVEAARLCAAATPSEILVAEIVSLLARGRGHQLSAPRLLELKGLPEPAAARTVTWPPLPGAPLPPKMQAAGKVAFCGRVEETAILDRAWDDARRGERRVVLVAGEPGIGKTRLASEAARRAHAAGAIVLLGSCHEDVGLPYEPFVEALRHLVQTADESLLREHVRDQHGELLRMVPQLADRVPDVPLPAPAEGELARHLMFEAVAHLLRLASRESPLVLMLDDLQWAGATDLLLLEHVVRSTSDARLLVLATYRDTELSRLHPLPRAVADLARETGVARIEVRGLDERGVQQLVSAVVGGELGAAAPALSNALRAETSGSPFFVAETVRSWLESGRISRRDGAWSLESLDESPPLPESVRETIHRRIGRLSESCAKLLELASVVGTEFDLEVLQRVAALSESETLDRLDEARAAGLVHELAAPLGRFAFAHGLIRTTLYGDLGNFRRARVHRMVATALEHCASIGEGDRVNQLAHHWLAATALADTAKAVGYSRQAGDQAMAALAFGEAEAHYQRALDALELQSDNDRHLACDLRLALADAQRHGGNPSYRDSVRLAAGLARELHDAERLAHAALYSASATNYLTTTSAPVADAAVIANYEEALAALGPAESVLRVQIQSQLAVELILTREHARRDELSAEAVAIARRLGDESVLFQAVLCRCVALGDALHLPERLTLIEEAERLAARVKNAEWVWQATSQRAVAALESGDAAAAAAHVETLGRLATQLHQPLYTHSVALTEAMLALLRGAPDAESRVMEACALGVRERLPHAWNGLGIQLGALRDDQGRLGELLDLARMAVQGSLPEQARIAGEAALAWIYCDGGLFDEARAVFDEVASAGFPVPLDWSWAGTLTALAYSCAELRDRDRAQTLYGMLAPVARQVGTVCHVVTCVGSLALPSGLLAACAERWELAVEHFELALAMNERIGARPAHVRTRRAYASMLLDRREPRLLPRAADLVAAGAAEAAALGMAGEVVRLDRLRQRLRAASW